MSLGLSVRRFSVFLLVFGVFVPCTLGVPTCLSGWGWANNTLNQNPCEIAAALDAQCGNYSSYLLPNLQPGDYYVAPQAENDTLGQECNCNTVVYSLYMACTGCQNGSVQQWSDWRLYCKAQYVTQYPDIIPPHTAVPHWAYLNYTEGDIFDPVLAKAAGGPESLAPVPPTLSVSNTISSSSPTGPPGTRETSGPTNPASNQGSDNGGKTPSHVGAIVGGVIGGLAALAVTGVGAWIFFRKRATVHGDGGYPDYTKVSTAPPTSENEIPPSHPRLYDPSDPSTYPGHVDYARSGPYTTAPQSGHYAGIPEL